MNSKERYTDFCKTAYVPIFSKPWWLDAAVGEENWDVFVLEKSGVFCAALPYYLTNRDGYKIITKAPNTQNNGIIINYPEGQKATTKLDYEEKCITACCDYIESLGLDKYEQQYHYSFQNWLPFFWRYYKEITRYTYVIDTSKSIEEIESGYATNLRNHIRKARKIVSLSKDEISADRFFEVNRMSFNRQGREIPYSLDFVKRIYTACKEHDACKIFCAEDEAGNIHSVALLVWDEKSAYYLLNGTDPKYKASQANDFLIDEAIKFSKNKGLLFDFEGSVIRPIEHAFREFGGERKAYFRIYKTFNKELLKKELEEQLSQV